MTWSNLVRAAISYLQFMLFTVDDNRSDLLVEEDEDGREKGGQDADQRDPPVRHR